MSKDCKELNENTSYCEKRRMYVNESICKECNDYHKPTLNENRSILVD